MSKRIKVEYVKNLYPIFTKPKRIKIIVGGRGSTKSTGVADYVAAKMSAGELWCCARENQNSIEESVHRTILDEIGRLGMGGFEETKTSITHLPTGGRAFYRGLARNITSLKSTLSGIDGLWIEEGEDVSANTLRVLTASVRLNATGTEALLDGRNVESIEELEAILAESDIKMPEIIITMNRGARTGAIAQQWLSRAESDLQRCGYYEDDLIMVVEMNYTDMPKSWFIASGLEIERIDDEQKMSTAAYRAKWLSDYLDEVDNALITAEQFDACIDAHKKLGFSPIGAKYAAHDPSDLGPDTKGYAMRHGSIVMSIEEKVDGNVNEGARWAADLAIRDNVDHFTWDGDGLGAPLREQIAKSFQGKRTAVAMFRGSERVDNPDSIYAPTDKHAIQGQLLTKNAVKNKRAQYYAELRGRCYRTWQAVEEGVYHDPDTLISFDSSIELLNKLRSELCTIPVKPNGNGLIELYTKAVMKARFKLDSPNLGDSVMMLMRAQTHTAIAPAMPKPIRAGGR